MVTRKGIISYNMNDVLNKHRNSPSETVTTVTKRDAVLVLPYLGFQSEVFMVFVNLRLIFQNTCRIKSFFSLQGSFESLAII